MGETLRQTRVVIQEKGGVILTGIFTKREEGFLKLKDAEIIGRNVTIKIDRVWVDRSSVGHIHEAVESATE